MASAGGDFPRMTSAAFYGNEFHANRPFKPRALAADPREIR
jgi:hypothetical protein